jgi:uncharacterized protein (TIGR02231 family)
VELYPVGAEITRSVTLEASANQSASIEVSGLPASLLASSVQISAADDAEVRIGGFVFLSNENPVKEDDPRTADLRAVLEQIDGSLNKLRVEREAIQSRIAHYRKLAESISKSLEEDADGGTFDLAQTAWSKLEEVRADGENRLAALAKEEKALGIKRKEAEKNLNEKVAELRRLSGVLRFDLSGSLSDGVGLVLKYQMREASWQPVHEIRADPSSGTVEWVYKARIQQNTGEDWEDVAVTLNSASALHAGGLPELDPLFLNRTEVRPMSQGKSSSRVMLESIVAYDAASPPQQAQPESTTTGFFLKIPKKLSLESGGQAAVREAFTGSLQATFWSSAVPELSTDAWLMAGMTNELGWPILGGEAYSYIDGQLVSRRWIPSSAAGEELELSLGRNEKVHIERKERVKKQSEGGLIDKTKRHDIKFETSVENRMSVAHRIVLQDRFPIGRDNKIQVRISQPKDVEPEEGTGIFKWERELQPGGSTVMTTEYTVIYPAEWSIYPPL